MGLKGNDILEQAVNGFSLISDTTATTGDFGGLLVINDTTVTAVTAGARFLNFDDIIVANDNVTLPAGLYIPVEFTAITLATGAVAAINKY